MGTRALRFGVESFCTRALGFRLRTFDELPGVSRFEVGVRCSGLKLKFIRSVPDFG